MNRYCVAYDGAYAQRAAKHTGYDDFASLASRQVGDLPGVVRTCYERKLGPEEL